MNRTYDVIIYGATGFTGKLVAEYINNQYGTDGSLKWAMAGRNQQKLEQVRTELGNENIPILTADSMNAEEVAELAKQTNVVCTTVGPYAKYGDNMVAACVENGTDYCDLTGEVQWIRKMIDAHHETAKANGTRIVHCCGFDSVPSDMGVYFIQNEAKERTGNYANEVKVRVKAMKGKMSGGTYASLSNVMQEAKKDKSLFKVLANPYGLNPKGETTGPDKDLSEAKFDKDFGKWVTPFIMAGINTKVVRRAHALKGYPYGKDFQYKEATLAKGKWGAKLASGGGKVFMAAQFVPILKKIVDGILPKPGEGPNKEERETGFYDFRLLGKMNNGMSIKAKILGDRDPGYGSTSKMLAEAAICLAKDKDTSPKVSGVLTPSVALGEPYLKRLQANAGLTFEILE